MLKKITPIAILLLLMTTGCASDKKSSVDANKNEIRDDVDQKISETYANAPELKIVVEQLAHAHQAFLTADQKEDVVQASKDMMMAMDCVSSAIDDVDTMNLAYDNIKAWTYNTKKRYVHYLKNQKHLGGMYFSDNQQPDCWVR